MVYNKNEFCEGCEQNCQYGYRIEAADGVIYPTLNCRVVDGYWISRSEHKTIEAGEIKTPEQAIEIARMVARKCNHNVLNRRVK